MKLSYLIKNMGRSIILSLCLSAFAFGVENVDQVDYQNVKTIVETHLDHNQGLLDSSRGRDIVVFLGNTGGGKSTVINYLSEKGLQVDGFSDIVLENSGDPSAMVISRGGDSETFLPLWKRQP